MIFPDPRVVFQGAHVVAVDKPSGWLSVPSRLGAADKRSSVGRWLEKELNQRLFPLHRLDEPVSGLLLFARSPQAQVAISSWFEDRRVQKKYVAATLSLPKAWQWGDCPWDAHQRFDEAQLWRCSLSKGKRRSFVDPQNGKNSETKAFLRGKGILQDEPCFQWELYPLTGRSHQLRIHLALSGFPILGDSLYGCDVSFSNGIALRSVEIVFPSESGKWDLPTSLSVPLESSLFLQPSL